MKYEGQCLGFNWLEIQCFNLTKSRLRTNQKRFNVLNVYRKIWYRSKWIWIYYLFDIFSNENIICLFYVCARGHLIEMNSQWNISQSLVLYIFIHINCSQLNYHTIVSNIIAICLALRVIFRVETIGHLYMFSHPLDFSLNDLYKHPEKDS